MAFSDEGGCTLSRCLKERGEAFREQSQEEVGVLCDKVPSEVRGNDTGMTCIDNDIVCRRNASGQFVGEEEIGKFRVAVVQNRKSGLLSVDIIKINRSNVSMCSGAHHNDPGHTKKRISVAERHPFSVHMYTFRGS